jgi:nucleoside 2-deoxyribosyltransferase
MIVEVGFVVAAGTAVYEYFTNAKFKAVVKTELANAQTTVANLKVKAAGVEKVAVTDFTAVEAAVKNILAKL